MQVGAWAPFTILPSVSLGGMLAMVRSLIPGSLVGAVMSVACSTPITTGPWDTASSHARNSDTEFPEPEQHDGPGLTREEIRMVVRAKLPQIRGCYQAGLARTPQLGGRTLLRFAIGPDGKAGEIEIVEDQLGDPEVASCLVTALASWQFPRPRDGSSIVISYPFSFSSEQSLRAAGLPRVEGTIKPEAVGAVFDARRTELDGCLPAQAASASVGSIGVAFNVDDGGAVTRISAYHDSLPDDAGACVLRTISTWRFPPAASGDEARINHDLSW